MTSTAFTATDFQRYFRVRLGRTFNGNRNVSLRCPLHKGGKEHNPSFSLDIEKGVWKCHAGCGEGGMIAFEELFSHCDHETAVRKVFEILGRERSHNTSQPPEAEYIYKGITGQTLFRKLRFPNHKFTLQRRVGQSWIYGLEGIRDKPLYRLPEVITANVVLVAEGEKDCDRLESLRLGELEPGARFACTTNFDGAGKWRDDYAKYFGGKWVVIFADNDEIGRMHAREIARSVLPVAQAVKLIEFPELPEHGDVSDWLQTHDRVELRTLIQRTPQWKEESVASTDRPDMPADVLDGRLGELAQTHLRNYPLAYAWPTLLTAAGALVPRQGSKIRTNLYTCLVGPAGSGKSVTEDAVITLLGLSTNPILLKAKFGSAEGLIAKLKDLENATRLLDVDELSHLLAKSAIDRASFPGILSTAYYQDVQEGGTKHDEWTMDCRLSITGGIVEEKFGDALGLATTGGLYDRFIFGLAPEPYEFLYQPFDGPAVRIDPIPSLVDREVWEVRNEWVKTEGIPPRIAEHSLRIAYIAACADGRPTLRAAELGSALAFARYQAATRKVLTPNPGENPDARCAIAIRAWLAKAKEGEWKRRRDLHRGISASRLGPTVFNRSLKGLEFNNEIETDQNGTLLRLKPC